MNILAGTMGFAELPFTSNFTFLKPEGPTEAEVKELHVEIGMLAVENDFFPQGLKKVGPAWKGSIIRRDHPELRISQQCHLLKLGRSAFYYAPVGIGAEPPASRPLSTKRLTSAERSCAAPPDRYRHASCNPSFRPPFFQNGGCPAEAGIVRRADANALVASNMNSRCWSMNWRSSPG